MPSIRHLFQDWLSKTRSVTPVSAVDPLALNLRPFPFNPPLIAVTAAPGWPSAISVTDVVVTTLLPGRDSPGTTPKSFRRAINAQMALNHLISSSSLGAHSRSVRLVVTILNVCDLPSGADEGGMGDEADSGGVAGMWRLGGRSYSSASRICENLNSRCGFVSYNKQDFSCHTRKMGRVTDHVAARVD
jgi:hypothetical protein